MQALVDGENPRREWPADLWRIGFIILLALTTRTWIVAHTEVLSRDGINFIRFALQLEDPPSAPAHPERPMTRAEVLRGSFQAPGYSATVLAVSWPVRWVMGGTSCDAMTLSAQLASVLASLLLVVPMYYLGKLVFDRQTAFVGSMLFQVLPCSSHVACDGLSDNLFLFFTVAATYLAALGFRRDCARWFGAAGMMSGVAYLVRPEGVLVVAVTGLVLAWSKLRGSIGWRALLARGGMLTAGLLIVMTPYVVTIGRPTNKPTGEQFFHWLSGAEFKPSWLSTSQAPPPRPTADFPLAEWFPDLGSGNQPDGFWACKALTKELLKSSFYVLPFFAALGLSVLWPRVRGDSAALLIVALGLCHSLLLWRIAKGAGYVAERHTLLIVLCGSYFTAASFPVLGEKLARLAVCRRLGSANFWSAVVAVVVIAACVPAALRPLHSNRAGHRAAGLWLAAHQQPGEYVLDPFAWGEYYSGYMRLPPPQKPAPRTAYVIMESNANMHPRLHVMYLAKFFADRGGRRIVYHWPENVPVERGKVFVYLWEGDDFGQLWNQAYDEHRLKITGAAP